MPRTPDALMPQLIRSYRNHYRLLHNVFAMLHTAMTVCCQHKNVSMVGEIAASGYALQPNIQERDFKWHAPLLDLLDPAKVHKWHGEIGHVDHNCGIHFPAYEEIRPACTSSVIECGDTPTLAQILLESSPTLGTTFSSRIRQSLDRIHSTMRSDSIPTTMKHS